MENSDSNRPDFWSTRYAAGNIPWDFGGVPAALKSFLAESSVQSEVLIPGCGSGYEVQPFHAAGHDVMAIDFSPAAVERARKVLDCLGDRVILADFFTHDFGQRRFDLIYERTFLCSMAPSRWPEYVKRIADLLSPGGKLIGIFLYGERSCPPFPLGHIESEQLFKQHFQLLLSKIVTDSLRIFRGREKWQEWLKIDSA
jgi:SAM-dependent methyltransferase